MQGEEIPMPLPFQMSVMVFALPFHTSDTLHPAFQALLAGRQGCERGV